MMIPPFLGFRCEQHVLCQSRAMHSADFSVTCAVSVRNAEDARRKIAPYLGEVGGGVACARASYSLGPTHTSSVLSSGGGGGGRQGVDLGACNRLPGMAEACVVRGASAPADVRTGDAPARCSRPSAGNGHWRTQVQADRGRTCPCIAAV
eukprot:3675326-Rhodomonas_salina.1